MDRLVKPKHLILQDLTAEVLRLNPMKLSVENPLEYEAEALSILSRFSEAALHLADDEAAVAAVATAIVQQTFEFWFDSLDGLEPESIARALVAVYKRAYEVEQPKPQGKKKRVTSVTVGE
jgi:hypothetical protein